MIRKLCNEFFNVFNSKKNLFTETPTQVNNTSNTFLDMMQSLNRTSVLYDKIGELKYMENRITSITNLIKNNSHNLSEKDLNYYMAELLLIKNKSNNM